MRPTLAVLTLLAVSTPALAQEATPGPAIHSFGAVFDVADPDLATPTDMEYKVAFEIAQASNSPERVNAALNTVARFINMHASHAVDPANMRIAVVVHGGGPQGSACGDYESLAPSRRGRMLLTHTDGGNAIGEE